MITEGSDKWHVCCNIYQNKVKWGKNESGFTQKQLIDISLHVHVFTAANVGSVASNRRRQFCDERAEARDSQGNRSLFVIYLLTHGEFLFESELWPRVRVDVMRGSSVGHFYKYSVRAFSICYIKYNTLTNIWYMTHADVYYDARTFFWLACLCGNNRV